MTSNQLDRFLFVVIPGAGGSVLERRSTTRSEVVWAGTGDAARRVVDPAVLEVGDSDGIVATGAVSDWQLGPLNLVPGYGGLVRTIANLVPSSSIDHGDPGRRLLDARVVVFPFDFRRSVVEAAELLDQNLSERFEHFGWEKTERRVVVVAHSMGGLVARYWAGPLGGHDRCQGIVTLGTPHRGSPKAVDIAANGFPLGPIRVAHRLSALLRTWPGFNELLPRYPMVEQASDDGPVFSYPKDLDVGWLDSSLTKRAWTVHREVEQVWRALGPQEAPSVLPVYGAGISTPEACSLGMADALTTSTERPAHFGNAEWKGDKTVPSISAIPLELDTAQTKFAHRPSPGVKHGQLVDWTGVEAALRYMATDVTSHVRGPGDRQIVVDCDEVWPSGHALSGLVRAYERIDELDPQLVEIDDIVRVEYNTDGHWRDASRSDDSWVFDLDGTEMTAGDVAVEVQVITGSGDDPPSTAAQVKVIDPEVLEDRGW